MKKLVAITILAASAASAQTPSVDTKTFIQVCKQPITDSDSAIRYGYCAGYVAGIADTSRDVHVSGTYGEVLEATVGWMRSQELSTTPISKFMPIDNMWVGEAVHEALLTLYPRK
jgi:hypothetical protein